MSVYTTFKLILCVINIILTNVQKIWDELRDAKTMKTIVRKKKTYGHSNHIPTTGIISTGIKRASLSRVNYH